jgi:hypothetical protein
MKKIGNGQIIRRTALAGLGATAALGALPFRSAEFNAGRNIADVMLTFPDDAMFAGVDKGGRALEWTPEELSAFKPVVNRGNIVEVGADRLRAYSRSALAPGSSAFLSFDARDYRLVDDTPSTEARALRA